MARPTTLPAAALTALALLAAAPAADAAVLSGYRDDPAGDARNLDGADVPVATRDVRQVRSAFDDVAGTWTVTVLFREAPAAGDVAQVHARLYEARGDACPVGDNAAQIAGLDGGTSPSSTAERWTVLTPGQVAEGGNDGGKTTSADGLEVTLTATSARLTGRAAHCVDLTVTHNGVLDRLDTPLTLAPPAVDPGTGEPVPPPPPPPPVDVPPDPPLALALTRAPRLKAGTLTVTLAPLDRAATGVAALQLRRAHRWRTVATRGFVAQAERRTTVRLRPGKQDLRRARRLPARLVVTAADGNAAPVTGRFTLKLRR